MRGAKKKVDMKVGDRVKVVAGKRTGVHGKIVKIRKSDGHIEVELDKPIQRMITIRYASFSPGKLELETNNHSEVLT